LGFLRQSMQKRYNAKENARLNNIQNAKFFVGDTKVVFEELVGRKGVKPDVVFVDPPRKGLDVSTINILMEIKPRRVIYISCNPATLVRDLHLLEEIYEISSITPVDLFPFTSHVECVAELTKKSSLCSEKLKIEYKFDLKDFEMMENIEHSYFPNENITPAEEVLNWYKKNNLTCIGLKNSNNEIIAFVNILPLNKEVFYDIYEDKINEADVVYNQIEEYEDNKSYYIYLSSISIDKRYRNNYIVIINLLKGCINILNLLFERNIKIEKVMADASTIHGEKICKKLLKMDYIRNTSHESKIYCEDGEKFMKVLKLVEY